MPALDQKTRNENIKRNREMLLALGPGELKAYVLPKTSKEVVPAVKSSTTFDPPPLSLQTTRATPSPYEKIRNERVKRNREILLALGPDELNTYVSSKTPKETTTTPYERLRNENIKRNKEMLLALGLDKSNTYVPPKTAKKTVTVAKSRKRKPPPLQDTKDEDESDAKVSKTRAAQDITNTSGVRRSARNAGKAVDYKSEIVTTFPEVISAAAKVVKNSEGKKNSERRHNPYVDLFVSCYAIVNRSV